MLKQGMNFYDAPPSSEWGTLSYRGQAFAEAWLKPNDQRFELTIRVPSTSLSLPEISPLLSINNLLRGVGINLSNVDSWWFEDEQGTPLVDYSPEPNKPLPPVPASVAFFHFRVRMKEPSSAETKQVTRDGDETQDLLKWQELRSRWNTIVGIEVIIDTLRQRMESLKSEIESATAKQLSTDEKVNGMNADVAQWTKAKNRSRHVLPSIKEFVHRATWVLGTPERKKLEELFATEAEPANLPPDLSIDLTFLLKDRQLLSAQGNTCQQEGKASCEEIYRSLRTLQANANSNAIKKRAANRGKNY